MNSDDDDFMHLAEQRMEEAFSNIDKELIREYCTAEETIPHIVENETPYIAFLRYENNDPIKAARRLALHWKYRKSIYGDRWLLPMTQTGTGTLTMNDIQILRTGYLHVVPTPSGPVVLSDGSKLQHALPGALDRCVFYMLTINSDEMAQTKGGILLSVISSRKGPFKTIKQKQNMWEYVHSALAFKIRKAVVVRSYEEHKELLLEFLAYQQSRLLQFSSGVDTDLVAEDSFANTLRGLMKAGFGRSHIPVSLGGDFDYGSLSEWTRMRISLEDAMGSAPPKRNALPRRVIMGSGGPSSPNTSSKAIVGRRASNPKSKASIVGEEHNKKRNATYARRSYQRRKIEVVLQQEEFTVLQRKNSALRAEEQRLEALLREAQRIALAVQTNGFIPEPVEAFRAAPANTRFDSGESINSHGIISESDSGVFSSYSGSGNIGERAMTMAATSTPVFQGNAEWHEHSLLRDLWMGK